MTGRVALACLALTSLLAPGLTTGCASFERSLIEFDSVTGRDRAIEEPDAIEYEDEPLMYPQLAVLADWIGSWFGATVFDVDEQRAKRAARITAKATAASKPTLPAPRRNSDPEAGQDALTENFPNPSVLARERLESLVARSAGSRYRTAIAGNRALWFLALDSYPRNLVLGVDSAAVILERMEVNPVKVPVASMPTREDEARIAGNITVLEKYWPVHRKGALLTPEERAIYARVLLELTRAPIGNRKTQRSLVRALAEAERGETDAMLEAAAGAALDRALTFALATGVRDAVRAPQTEARQAREAAMLAIYRLGGVQAVPDLVAWCTRARSQGLPPARRYDPDPQNRRTLVRLCSLVSKEIALSARGSSPAPVEFLYEVATNDLPELRVIALEALALCLDRKRTFDPVTLDDREWIDAWWRDYAMGTKRSP